jgi:hypothetical protein
MRTVIRRLAAGVLLLGLSFAAVAAESVAPKKLLVVSTSTRNRFQASIDAAEKALVRLAEESHTFTIEFVRQPVAPQPKKPKPSSALKFLTHLLSGIQWALRLGPESQ